MAPVTLARKISETLSELAPPSTIHTVTASFADATAARTAAEALRRAPLDNSSISIAVDGLETGEEIVPLRSRPGDRLRSGAVLGGIGGLFAAVALLQAFGAGADKGIVLTTVLFATLGGALVGALITGTGAPAAGDDPPPLSSYAGTGPVMLRISSRNLQDVYTAAQVLASYGALGVSGPPAEAPVSRK